VRSGSVVSTDDTDGIGGGVGCGDAVIDASGAAVVALAAQQEEAGCRRQGAGIWSLGFAPPSTPLLRN
jgi:hypothetical protein